MRLFCILLLISSLVYIQCKLKKSQQREAGKDYINRDNLYSLLKNKEENEDSYEYGSYEEYGEDYGDDAPMPKNPIKMKNQKHPNSMKRIKGVHLRTKKQQLHKRFAN